MRSKRTLPSTDPQAAKPSSGNRAPLRFPRVRGNRPADEIITQIRAHIAAQTLRRGDRLPSERELAQQFQVSRNSVRQALRALVGLGLLNIRKGAAGGAFIAEGGGEAVMAGLADMYSLGTIRPEHLTEVRILVGVEVAKLACERCTLEDIAALEANVVLAEQAVRSRDTERRTQINLEFHRMLARMTRNPILVTLTDAVSLITEQFVKEIGPSSNQAVMPLRRRLLHHLRTRNAPAAAQEMRNHLLKLQEIYLRDTRKS
jgi:DNA-binding FadR family transcriptional regulator